MKRKAALALITSAAAVGAAGVALAGPASAATSPAAVCGSGYSVIDHKALTGSTVYLLWNGSSGRNCVVTVKTTSVGTKTRTGAYLYVQGSSPIEDTDSYAYYAGPVSAPAVGKCVQWGGGTNNQFWYSGWTHCT